MALYEIAVMGAPSAAQIAELEKQISEVIAPFGLRLGHEVAWSICPTNFKTDQKTSAAVAFFGGTGVSGAGMDAVLREGVPVLPIASTQANIGTEIPVPLRALNCLTYSDNGPIRIATALLECLGLLPRQRTVFLSYRRDEARDAVVQLFNALSARVFDVFLDTHGIAPGNDFQAVLWHRLCDSDVLIMLDTPGYFESRWTNAEYGRALAKGISVLRVGWPGVGPSPRTATASRLELTPSEVDATTGRLGEDAIDRICTQLEIVRGRSHAVRSLNLFSKLQQAIECIGGTVSGVGIHNAVYLKLPEGTDIVAYPTVGVPTSLTLNDAVVHAVGRSAAVVFDHIGLDQKWLEHLGWLGSNIPAARWVRASEAAWSFAGWGVR
jgi:TIR domain